MKSSLPNLRKVLYAREWWDNGKGVECRVKPLCATINGIVIMPTGLCHPHPLYPGENELQRATRLGILDKWTYCCEFIFPNNHRLVFKGEEAKKMWSSYKGVVFNKAKNNLL